MMNSHMKKPYNVAVGTIITGKWHKQRYHILKQLGEGANGTVYLADFDGRQVALKLSDNYASIASEINVLKSFTKVQGSSLGPYLLHGDDWIQKDRSIPYYVMEYIKGPDLLTFTRNHGPEWIEILMLQLLSNLDVLHRAGWVFGDLKPENLIVTLPEYKVRCVDVGGTTMVGRSIKEFTEFFDRGYWGMGTRKAEPSYDLFAVAMIFINVYYPNRFHKKGDTHNQLMEVLSNTKALVRYQPVLKKAILGKYSTCIEMREELLQLINLPKTRTSDRLTRQRTKKRKRKSSHVIGEMVLLLVVLCFLYGLYIYTQILG